KDNKRYWHYRALQRSVPALAPDVEPDYAVIPGGDAMKARIEHQQAQARKMGIVAKRRTRIPTTSNDFFAFDGRVMRQKYGNLAAIQSKPYLVNMDGYFPQYYTGNIGLVLPDPIDPGFKDGLLSPLLSTEWEKLPEAFQLGRYRAKATMELMDGAQCTVLEWPGHDKLWLDPQIGFAVRCRELRDPASQLLVERRRNFDFAEAAPGIWLPHLCWRDRCGPPLAPPPYAGKPLVRDVYSVNRLLLNNVPDDLFTLRIDPGRVVIDFTAVPNKKNKDDGLVYIMPADASRLDQTIQEALDKRAASESRQFWTKVIVAANACGLLAVAIYLVLRRRAKTSGGLPKQ
ncbi:MAG TPA: hypothetical protein VFA18_01925, partial [Gemmataceae bacterium]|nr:hypothetical protein [Gemmataceae bacterium]